jgi:uncharacterized protein
MGGTMRYLQQREQAALGECAVRLVTALRGNLSGLWLFGSKARGNFGADSDIDLLVVLRTHEPEKRWLIRTVAAECSLQHDVLLNTHIISQARWDEAALSHDALWRQIQEDGLPLMPEMAPTST